MNKQLLRGLAVLILLIQPLNAANMSREAAITDNGGGGRNGGNWRPGGFPMAQAIRICQNSVTSRLNRLGYPRVNFGRTVPDNNPGRNDRVTGFVSGKRGYETTLFSFSCSVDFRSGTVRSVDVRRR
jgi:hypothetical protein